MANRPTKTRQTACLVGELDQLLVDLESPDDMVRERALQQMCPCHSWRRYEQHIDLVQQFRKDPSLLVRQVAAHIEGEVGEIEAIERWVDLVTDDDLPCGDRDFVRRRLEKRRLRRGY